MLRLLCYVFAHECLFNPQFDLERDYIILQRGGIDAPFPNDFGEDLL